MGTSNCHLIMSDKEKFIPGIAGVVKDGILPGYFAYEAGQSCVGDQFAWFTDNCVPKDYYDNANSIDKDIHEYLQEKANQLKVGESGLIALDWWNGVRSVLMNADLTGLIIGMTLQTKPEEIYRALVESTAFGTRKIIETFEYNGIKVDELYAAGGIVHKSSFIMQIYSDVCNREIRVTGSKQSGALGSAFLGITASGYEQSGYKSLNEVVNKLGNLENTVYKPNPKNKAKYDSLYNEYELLHDYFGLGINNVMKRLKSIKETP